MNRIGRPAGDPGDRMTGLGPHSAVSIWCTIGRVVLLSLCIVLLGACAELKPYLYGPTGEPPEGAWDRHRTDVAGLHNWNLNGRLALSRGKEGWSARLNWRQRGAHYRLRLQAPLGQGTFELSGAPGEVRITTSEGKQYQAASADELMQQTLGWAVPVTGLGYWVRGIPRPGQRYRRISLDAEGRMTDLDQAGWRISILRYLYAGKYSLPGKIFMLNDALKIRLVIEAWRGVSP